MAIPDLALLLGQETRVLKHVRGAECYIALCHLTEIVGDILPLLYHLRSGNDTFAAAQASNSEEALGRWIRSLPEWLQLHEFDNRPSAPGICNLQLSYLSVKMLLSRIAWHEISQREINPHSMWLLNCQTAASEVVRFALSLQPSDLKGFWFPYNAHHFTSAVTLLLRCALQTRGTEVRRRCIGSARLLVDFLRRAKDEDNWDLAETCLAQSEQMLARVETAFPLTKQENSSYEPTQSFYNGDCAVNGEYTTNSLYQDHFNDIHLSVEELFPEIFLEFSDTAMLGVPTSQSSCRGPIK